MHRIIKLIFYQFAYKILFGFFLFFIFYIIFFEPGLVAAIKHCCVAVRSSETLWATVSGICFLRFYFFFRLLELLKVQECDARKAQSPLMPGYKKVFEKCILVNLCMQSIILASQSPRRKQLLEWAEIPFEIVVKSTAETFPLGLPVEEIPIYIARQKAIEVKNYIDELLHEHKGKKILAADTVVVLDKQIIGKPVDRKDAIDILTALSGKTHRVITGVVIMFEKVEKSFADITAVEFHNLTAAQIEFYVDKYEPYDKAGAYAIQEWVGVIGIKSINGDFYNVMGLPVSRVVQELQNQDLLGYKGFFRK